MKRSFFYFLCAALLALSCGCARQTNSDSSVRVVCSAFVPYDFVLQIAGERQQVQVQLLADNGADPHSFQPAAADLAAVHTADLFVYIGGESESWAADAAAQAAIEGVRTLCLSDLVNVYEEEDHEAHEEHSHDHDEAVFDEHVWLSLANARTLCAGICDALCAVDPAGEAIYRAGLSAYDGELASLEQEYTDMRESAVRDVILVADRFPFLYLTKELDLRYYAAFPGCSAETEASFETVAYLADRLKSEELPAVLVTESSDGKLARTVCKTAEREVPMLTLHSLQSVSKEERETGEGYLSFMRENLEVLRKALN